MPKPDYNGAMKQSGKRAEAVVKNFLCKWARIRDVKDYTEVEEWQALDIDFEAVFDDGRKEWVEVKNDRNISRSGNFPFELNRLNHRHKSLHNRVKLGWSVYSQAHKFIVYAEEDGQLYVFEAEDVNNGFHRYILDKRLSKNPKTGIQTRWICTDDERTTLIILVPLHYFQYRVFRQIDGRWRWVKTTWKGEQLP